jgi:predicted RNase H-like HicB family nuclease
MLAHFLDVAMELAHFDIIQEDGTFWGEVPGFQGVWARHQTLAGCQRELREALSDWIALRLKLGLEIPELAQMNLNQIGAVSNA